MATRTQKTRSSFHNRSFSKVRQTQQQLQHQPAKTTSINTHHCNNNSNRYNKYNKYNKYSQNLNNMAFNSDKAIQVNRINKVKRTNTTNQNHNTPQRQHVESREV